MERSKVDLTRAFNLLFSLYYANDYWISYLRMIQGLRYYRSEGTISRVERERVIGVGPTAKER